MSKLDTREMEVKSVIKLANGKPMPGPRVVELVGGFPKCEVYGVLRGMVANGVLEESHPHYAPPQDPPFPHKLYRIA